MAIEFYVDGVRVSRKGARAEFEHYHWIMADDELNAAWESCMIEEEARDEWFPSHLEMVQR